METGEFDHEGHEGDTKGGGFATDFTDFTDLVLAPRDDGPRGGRETRVGSRYARGSASDSQTGSFAIGCRSPRCVRFAATATPGWLYP